MYRPFALGVALVAPPLNLPERGNTSEPDASDSDVA
jgi:hypothetical protein